ncbi:hypothetical protein Tco_0642145 [Tanacetum coccineum]
MRSLRARKLCKRKKKRIELQKQAAKERYWKIPICDDDDDNDYTIAITPVLSTEEPVNSLIMENEHLDTIFCFFSATGIDNSIKSRVEILVQSQASPPILSQLAQKVMEIDYSRSGRIEDDIHNRLIESETFCFNLEEPSSGSPTTPSDLSLPDYEAFSNDHIEETSSGSTTTYSNSSFSKYDSFIFDLSINSYHPSNRSDFHEEFADELAQIISPTKSDCFFKDIPSWAIFTKDVGEIFFQTREPRVHVLNVLPTLELDFIPSSESIFAYVVWIFLPFLFIPVIPPYLLSCGDEDTIFDPGISKEVDIIKKAENQAKMTKLSMEWKRLCKIKAKVQKCQSQSTKLEDHSPPEPETKNKHIGCNLNPSDGPGKPNSISMKTVKTKWALNQLQQPICVQLTKTVKTLKTQS